MPGVIELLDRPIAFHRVFVDIAGSVAGALLLSQAVYWNKRAANNGWFYKTAEEWKEETGLSRRELERARRELKDAGLMEELLKGVPAKLHYKLNSEALESSLRKTYKLDCHIPATQFAQNVQTITETTSETTAIHTNASEETPTLFPVEGADLRQLRSLIPHPELFDEASLHNFLADSIFMEQWREFNRDRAARGKKVTERSARIILNKCLEQPSRAAAALKLAIELGWTSFKWEWVDNYERKQTAKGIASNTNVPKPVVHNMEDRKAKRTQAPPPGSGKPNLFEKLA